MKNTIKSLKDVSQLSNIEILKIINELKVHKVEVEAQNEELMVARKAEQNALQKYNELYESAPVGYFTLTSSGKILDLNLSGSQILGKELKGLINGMFGFFVSDQTKPIFNHFLDNLFKTKNKETCEVILSTNINYSTYVHLTGIIANDEEHCLIIVLDITDIKLADEVVKVSETRYRRLFESAKDGILILNANSGRIMEVNPFLIDMLGYSKELLIDKEIWEIGFFKDIAANKEKFFELHQKKYVRYDDLPLETADDRKINVEFVSNVYLEGKNQVIQCNIRDITTRKHAEEALRASEEKYRFISENISDVVWIFNFTQDRFTYLSPSVKLMTGYTEHEAIAEGLNKLFSFESAQKLLKELSFRVNQFLNGIRITYVDEHHINCKDGKIKWLESVIKLHYDKYQAIEIHGVSRDITLRKQLMEEIRLKNEGLQTINDEKDKFFSIVAHDLRSPFSSFLGLTELMAEGLSQMSFDDIRETTSLMHTSATNLFQFLEHLLEWSRGQRGLATYVPFSFLLKLKISEIMVILSDKAILKHILINYDISKDLVVYADENMLDGIIRNLVSNSLKFTPNGGCITISAKLLQDKSVVISIKDSGVGMKKELLENLFRLDVDTKRIGTEGEYSTGLGLIICKDFVEKHGGKLWIESEEGVGSTFYFSLPAKQNEF